MTCSNRRSTLIIFAVLAAPDYASAKDAPPPPLKVAVTPKTTGQSADVPVRLDLELRDVNNRPAVARTDTQIEVQVAKPNSPKGEVESMDAVVKAGSSSATVTWEPKSAGVFRVKARERDNHLLDGTGAFLVQPAVKPEKADDDKPKSAPAKPAKAARKKVKKPRRAGPSGSLPRHARRAACQPASTAPVPPPAAAAAGRAETAAPELHVMVSGRDLDGTFADGIESAKIDVFYVTADGSNAPVPIKVWFAWRGGEVKPQPLVIEKGNSQAQAEWSARAPVLGTVQVSAVSPALKVFIDSDTKVRFVTPVKGLQMSGPTRLAFVEAGNLSVNFEGPDGTVVNNQEARDVAFSGESSAVRIDPEKVRMSPGDIQASISVAPKSFWGKAVIKASTGCYRPITHTVEITWLGCLLLTLVGGALGGVMRYLLSKGVVYLRLLVGVVMGSVAVLGFVTGIVQSDAAWFPAVIKHSLLSVPLAAFLGGWFGLELLDRAPFALVGAVVGKKAKS